MVGAVLRRRVLGLPVWWLLVGAAIAGAGYLWGWWVLGGVIPWLLGLPARNARAVPVPSPRRDTPARTAQDAHRATTEADSALATVAEEARSAGDVGRQRAMTDDVAEVKDRVEARARARGR